MNALLLLQVLWRLRRLHERDRWTRLELEQHQARSLARLREHAYARSPFYQRFHRGLDGRPLHELPVLTKAEVMEHFDELVSDRRVCLETVEAHLATVRHDERVLGRYRMCATSGTTGRRGLFLFDQDEWVTVLAAAARGHEWAGVPVSLTHHMRLASVASTMPWHMSARISASLQSRWVPALRLDAAEPIDRIVEALNEWEPEMLVVYPSVGRGLADKQLGSHLRIAPRLIFTGAEVLTAETRRRIRAAWGVEAFNEYAATESGPLAAECSEHQGLHLLEDLAIVEVVDEANHPVPPGAYGDKLLITVLFGRTQPLIRYELSDVLRLAPQPCPCGRPYALADDIQGRAEDVLYFPGVAGGEVSAHPNVFHRVMDALPTSGWQVVQDSAGLTVLLSDSGDDAVEDRVAEALWRELAALGAELPAVRAQRVRAIPRGPTGKAPLVTSRLQRSTPNP